MCVCVCVRARVEYPDVPKSYVSKSGVTIPIPKPKFPGNLGNLIYYQVYKTMRRLLLHKRIPIQSKPG